MKSEMERRSKRKQRSETSSSSGSSSNPNHSSSLSRPVLARVKPQAQLISVQGAPKSKEGYAVIGGGSLLRQITDEQLWKQKNMAANIYVGMRYWYPFTEEAIQQIKKYRIIRLVMLSLYPQYSISTTGSSIRVLHSLFSEDAYLSRLSVAIIKSWFQREGYTKSMTDLIAKELERFSNPSEVIVFFSAHGVPLSYVEDVGDPYKDQMEECISLIMRELKARGIENEHTLTSLHTTSRRLQVRMRPCAGFMSTPTLHGIHVDPDHTSTLTIC
ncbi:hypothetical protein UlMin_012856 [Ulmus minor]